MKATGIVRRVDDLGRVVIPKEIRRAMNIHENDPLEIFIDHNEKAVCFRCYQPYFEPWRMLEDVAEALRDNDEFRKFAADVDALACKMKKSAQD